MKLFKFRGLSNKDSFNKVKEILEEKQFHCSKFSSFNDPMEWIFIWNNQEQIKQVFWEKDRYKICSFSGERGFEDPAIWSYYTNIFRWIAIEFSIEEEEIKKNIEKVRYNNKIKKLKKNLSEKDIKYILTKKFTARKNEDEHRFIKQQDNDKYKIKKNKRCIFLKTIS